LKVKFSLFFLILLSLMLSGNAQENPQVQKKTVLDVKVVGNKNVSSASIIAKVKIRPGQVFSQQLIDEDIKRLYATGFFTDVAVNVEEEPEGVVVIFDVQEAPYVEEVTFEGNRVFRAEKIAKWIQTKSGQFLDKWQLKTDLEEIRRRYLEKGYAQVVVDYKLDIDEETNRAKVRIIINEGGRIKISRIEIQGVRAFKKKRILKFMKTKSRNWFFWMGVYKHEVLKEDVEKIEDFYKRNGYLDVKVDYDKQYDARGNMIIVIKIDEGKQYRVGDITIEGNKAFPTEELVKVLKLKKNGVFSYYGLNEDVDSLRKFYADRGYIKAHIEAIPSVNPETGLVDIKYKLAENDIHYVNKIDIKGNVKTKDVVIRRELRIHPGDKFEWYKVDRSRQRLDNLGYFGEIDFEVQPTEEKNKEDLVVRVKEAKTGEFSIGAGYSSVDEFIGLVELSQRNFDLTNPPTFTGGGQRISLRAEMGTTRNDYELSFTEPWLFGYPYLFGLDLYQHTRERERDVGYAWDEKRRGFSLRFGKEISEYNSVYLRTRFDKVEISDVADDVSSELKAEEGEKNLHGIRLNFVRDTRDSAFNPTKGYYMSLGIENLGGFIGGDVDLIRYTDNFGFYYPVWNNWVLNLRLQSGIIDTYGDTDRVPVYERFFAGGAYTIRGYDERSVGPKDSVSKDPIGGEAMLVGNVELTFPLYENIKGAFFYDVGNVWEDKSDFGSGGYKSSVGIGVRLKTRLGPIQLDYGYPLNKGEGVPSSGKVHFSMGHRF